MTSKLTSSTQTFDISNLSKPHANPKFHHQGKKALIFPSHYHAAQNDSHPFQIAFLSRNIICGVFEW
jgi:hypothetical protein